MGMKGRVQFEVAVWVDQPWRAHAACLGAPTEVFFVNKGETTRPARAYCARCLVRPDCLDYAVETRQAAGVWGGSTERERRALRNGRLAPAELTARVEEKGRAQDGQGLLGIW